MRVVRLIHHRCDDYDGTEYIGAPDGLADHEVHRIIAEVQEELIRDAKVLRDAPDGPPKVSHFPDYNNADPNLTVAEVKALHAAQKGAYDAWQKENGSLARSFEKRLQERGLVPLWFDHPDILEVDCYWGHNHGLRLNYKAS